MPYVEHIWYEESGAGHPALFIPCPAVSRIYWRPIIDRLSDRLRCVAMDVRGHGRSGLGDRPWSFADIAADVALLVRRLELDRPLLVGYSAGGCIALWTALSHPECCGRLLLISGFATGQGLRLRLLVGLGLLAARTGCAALVGRSVVFTNHVRVAHARAMLPEAVRTEPESLRSFCRETLHPGLAHHLPEIRQPVLLVYGARDSAMRNHGRLLQKRLPDARTLFIPGAYHQVATQQPDLCAEAVAGFASLSANTSALQGGSEAGSN